MNDSKLDEWATACKKHNNKWRNRFFLPHVWFVNRYDDITLLVYNLCLIVDKHAHYGFRFYWKEIAVIAWHKGWGWKFWVRDEDLMGEK